MASTTGIEIGPSSCTLVEVRAGGPGPATIKAIRILGSGEWPSDHAAQADLLRSIRRTARLPRPAAVVVWDLPRTSAETPSARTAVQFIESAGFHIESIFSAPEALAQVARGRRHSSPHATVWTSLNVFGAAIAIVSGSDLLFARTFRWTYTAGLIESRAVLLQRYSLIAHLAPEVRRGIDAVRTSAGVMVDGLVTCGDLPDLRSLTMPLIEELDLEVETLDSTDGLRPAAKVSAERLADAAPAIRLACAAALSRPERVVPAALASLIGRNDAPPVPIRVATAVLLVGALAWSAFSFRSVLLRPTVRPLAAANRDARRANVTPSHIREQDGRAPIQSNSAPLERRTPPQADAPSESTPVSTVLSIRAPSPSKTAPPAAAANRRARSAVPLKDPLPRVDSILIDQDRRLALVDGSVVGVGDPVGPRIIVRIERDAIILREPSGLVVRASVHSGTGS